MLKNVSTSSVDSAVPALEARGIVKRFPGVVALKGVDFSLREGEIHAICGENGAGKSTLIKLLSGIHPAGSYEGELLASGRTLALRNVGDAEGAGIAVIYQELALIPEMSVAENVFLGREPTTRWGLVDRVAVYTQARELLAECGLAIDPTVKTNSLGVGQQQLVEIAKALAKRSRVLILDEPTAALSETEVETLLAILRELRRRGVSCIYISHKLDEVFAISDRITVLRDGMTVGTFAAKDVDKATVIRHMVGREIGELFPRRAEPAGKVMLAVEGLNVEGPGGHAGLRGISFEVRAGEVLGIGGLMGAGRSEVLMHLMGAWGRRTGGRVVLDGEVLDESTPERAIGAGLALVSEDRKRYGLILGQSVAFNLSLSSLGKTERMGLIDSAREFSRNRPQVEGLRIKAATMEVAVGKLSGGNQQKVVLGKVLLTEPKVILMDEPTRGIDVGAKVEIYNQINELTAKGLAVVLVSSELPELMGMSDRIVMLHEGEMGGEFDKAEATPERLMAAAMGH